ncbi:MAG: branched-chain amino acid aminotransferase, group [Verrucomicrobiaceae bacterium]|nr:branched-chain amino acid aminotransferase, group [Verrucomicrobiaceae bacterium]
MKIYIDGQMLDESEAKISVFDHGLLYGDGVFEGIRFYSGRIFRLHEHIVRLYESARAICLTIPMTFDEMMEATLKTVAVNGLRDGYIRLVITRGVGTLGLDPDRCPKASVIIIAATIALYPKERYEQGLTLITCATRRPTPASLSPRVKSLNYLNNIMAKIESKLAGCEEGIMLNEQGYVAECTGDNIFVVKNGKVTTPPTHSGALDGITRHAVMELMGKLGIDCKEEVMTRHELYTADELFLTGTAAEVIPAVSLDRREIGDGKPGPMTRRLVVEFTKMANSEGAPVPY